MGARGAMDANVSAMSHLSTPSSGWRVLDPPEDVAHSKDGSLLSTINSNIIDLKGMQPKDTESVTRDLAHALARSIATISRGSSREGSPEKGRISTREPSPKKVPGSPKRGGARRDAQSYLIPHNLLQTSQSSLSVNESASISEQNQDLERSTLLVRSLQEQTKRRMQEIDRLHADAEKDKTGPTLYNPAAFQPRGAALSTRVTNIVNGPSIRPKCAPKPALKSTETKKGKKGQALAIWKHELQMLESDLCTLSSHMNSLHLERQRRIEAWEANLREREEAIEAFQTKEFIDFALSSAQTAQRITNKEEELKFEEEMLHSEKLIIMQNIEELKKIRSNLETQHRLIETRERLDVSADLASLDARDEHLRVREVSVLAREHAVDQREVDAARKLIDIQERERHLQVKLLTVEELKSHIFEEFSAWEDDLMRQEKAASLAAAADTRKPLESFDKLEQHRRNSPLKVYSPLEVWSDKLDFERQRRHSPLKEWSDKLDAAREARRGSLFDWNGGPDATGDGMGPNKWPRHVSRQREIQALNDSLQRSKHNGILSVSF